MKSYVWVAALQLVATAAVASQITIKSSSGTTKIEKTATAFSYSDPSYQRSIKIKKCNESLVSRFFEEYKAKKKSSDRLPTNPKGVGLTLTDSFEKKPRKISRYSNFGKYLSNLQTDFLVVVVGTETLCKK